MPSAQKAQQRLQKHHIGYTPMHTCCKLAKASRQPEITTERGRTLILKAVRMSPCMFRMFSAVLSSRSASNRNSSWDGLILSSEIGPAMFLIRLRASNHPHAHVGVSGSTKMCHQMRDQFDGIVGRMPRGALLNARKRLGMLQFRLIIVQS